MLKKLSSLAALLAAALYPIGASAELSVAIVVEPSLKKEAFSVHAASLASKLGDAVRDKVSVRHNEDLSDALRATRTGEVDVFIAPPQVAASALAHGYELVGSNDREEVFVLVTRTDVQGPAELQGRRAYLPHQDSIYTYVTRGMLTASGTSLRQLREIEYAKYPQAGLIAVSLGKADATTARRVEFDQWTSEYPTYARSLRVSATSTPVPGGYSIVIRSAIPADRRALLHRWFAGASDVVGLKKAQVRPEPALYKSLSDLGHFTPTALPGATVVGFGEVQQLLKSGAVLVDTRSEKEYLQKRIPGAILASYVEKSLKDVSYDASLDSFPALKKLDKSKPHIFQCNGAECWKSYKASKSALAAGFSRVYWFRGGLPEWERAGLDVLTATTMASADTSRVMANASAATARN